MYRSPEWGNVNLGVDVLQGHGEQSQPGQQDYARDHPNAKVKQQYNPGRNQELKLPADIFPMHKNSETSPNAVGGEIKPYPGVHERIKELLGENMPRREAIIKAKQEARATQHGDVGTITQKEVYRSKYQAEQPSKKISPFSEQVQGYPFI